MTSSTCFKLEGSSSGRQLYRTHSSTYQTAYTNASRT